MMMALMAVAGTNVVVASAHGAPIPEVAPGSAQDRTRRVAPAHRQLSGQFIERQELTTT